MYSLRELDITSNTIPIEILFDRRIKADGIISNFSKDLTNFILFFQQKNGLLIKEDKDYINLSDHYNIENQSLEDFLEEVDNKEENLIFFIELPGDLFQKEKERKVLCRIILISNNSEIFQKTNHIFKTEMNNGIIDISYNIHANSPTGECFLEFTVTDISDHEYVYESNHFLIQLDVPNILDYNVFYNSEEIPDNFFNFLDISDNLMYESNIRLQFELNTDINIERSNFTIFYVSGISDFFVKYENDPGRFNRFLDDISNNTMRYTRSKNLKFIKNNERSYNVFFRICPSVTITEDYFLFFKGTLIDFAENKSLFNSADFGNKGILFVNSA